MSSVTIRRIQDDDIRQHFLPLWSYAFQSTPPLDVDKHYERYADVLAERVLLMLFEDDKPLATAGYIPMTQNIRGTILPMAGVAPVATNPLGRRKGYARRVVQALLQHMNEADYAVTTLYPFRESFYERLGYVTFTQKRRVFFKTAALNPILKMELPGMVEYVQVQDSWQIFVDFLKKQQLHRHGLGMFPPAHLASQSQTLEKWLAIARDEQQIIGVMIYKLDQFFGTMQVNDFFYHNSHGKYLLLNWLARHMDQSRAIDLALPGDERPETWVSDLEIKASPDVGLTPMGRIVNVARLEGISIGEGQLCVRVHDSFCDWNNGIYTLSAQDGHLQITSGGHVDCDISIEALSALIYGTHEADDFCWRGWTDATPQALAKMKALFARQSPYLWFQF